MIFTQMDRFIVVFGKLDCSLLKVIFAEHVWSVCKYSPSSSTPLFSWTEWCCSPNNLQHVLRKKAAASWKKKISSRKQDLSLLLILSPLVVFVTASLETSCHFHVFFWEIASKWDEQSWGNKLALNTQGTDVSRGRTWPSSWSIPSHHIPCCTCTYS